jgi:hypothetical protein
VPSLQKQQAETSKPHGKPFYTAEAEIRAGINLLNYGAESPRMSQDRPQKSTNYTFTVYNVNVVN